MRKTFCGLLALAGLVALAAPAQAEQYVRYRVFDAPPPPTTWNVYPYRSRQPFANCRYRATIAGAVDSPEFGFVYRCVEPVEYETPPRRRPLRVKG